MNQKTYGPTTSVNTGREMTAVEIIDRRIDDLLSQVEQARALKQKLEFTRYDSGANEVVRELLLQTERGRDNFPPFRL